MAGKGPVRVRRGDVPLPISGSPQLRSQPAELSTFSGLQAGWLARAAAVCGMAGASPPALTLALGQQTPECTLTHNKRHPTWCASNSLRPESDNVPSCFNFSGVEVVHMFAEMLAEPQ